MLSAYWEDTAEPCLGFAPHLPPSYSTALITVGPVSFPVTAFIDSGSDTNFIDQDFAARYQIPVLSLPQSSKIHSLNDQLLHQVSQKTHEISLTIDNHTESISFLVIQTPHHPVVLGIPWLSAHNPQIDWSSGAIRGLSSSCLSSCLRSAPAPEEEDLSEPEVFPDISKVPAVYHDLKVFNKKRTTSLPPHRPYDCAIDLLPDTSPSRGRLFSLSPPEQEAMRKYISEALKAGLIRPSSSPAGVGFFFVGKKDGGLRPCIDYRALNNINVRNRYPLPLLFSAFELLQEAKVFTKTRSA